MKSALIVLGLAIAAACSSGAPRGDRVIIADDAARGQSLNHFSYTGHWEHLAGRRDGRDDGTSSRSRIAGDSAVFTFIGSIVRLYGVRGPNGGDAGIGIDGTYYGTASFFAPKLEPHALVFVSPQLTPAPHALGIVVKGDAASSHHAYVNIDSAQVLPHQ